jgi:WD40 repeat protein
MLQSNECLISGSSDKTIKCWDINSGQCVNTIQAHNDSVVSLEILSAEQVISGSYGEIKIWNIRTSELMNTLMTPNWVRCIISYLNDRIISGGGDNTIKIWV